MAVPITSYANPGWANGGSPAINDTNLNAISNGLASVISTLNAAGPSNLIDAATVSGYGIGATGTQAPSNDLDLALKGGCYYIIGSTVHRPFDYGVCFTSVYIDNTAAGQIAIAIDGAFYYRARGSSAWMAWKKVWTETNDGNGGQPPLAKPIIGGTKDTLTQGQTWYEDIVSGANAVFPSCGGTAYMEIQTYGVIAASAYKHYISNAAGGTLGTVNGNCRIKWTRLT